MADISNDASRELLETFISEGKEQVQKVVDHLIKLESVEDADKKSKLIDLTFRELHNLKGSARAVGFNSVEIICHPLEDVMAALKRKQIELSAELLDLVLSSVCLVEKILSSNEAEVNDEARQSKQKLLRYMAQIGLNVSSFDNDAEQEEEPEDELSIKSVQLFQQNQEQEPITNKVQEINKQTAAPPIKEAGVPAQANQASKDVTPVQNQSSAPQKESKAAPPGKPKQGGVDKQKAKDSAGRVETLRIPTSKLDLFMQKAEEMISVKAMARQQRLSSQSLQGRLEEGVKNWQKLAPDVKAARQLMEKMRAQSNSPHEQIILRKMNDFLDWNYDFIQRINEEVKEISKTAYDYSHVTSTAVDVLLDETKRILMMPCASLLEGFPLTVRQLARELGKEVELTISGQDIELDKRILSQIRDPLIHLLRNSVDHGMETPEQREQLGKAKRGSVGISVAQIDGNIVEMRVSDDGKGIDVEKVKQSAVKMGFITAEEATKMSYEEGLSLIFKSQLSTSQIITEISGRGIGLSVVEENIKQLGGRLKIETELGKGTTFVITLPVTMATFRGVLVDVAAKTFVLPTTSIDRVVRVKKDEIKPVEGNNTMLLGDSLIPVCQMEDVLELPALVKKQNDDAKDKLMTVAILGAGDNRIGFVVDEVLEEQEVLVKSLGPVFAGVRNVSGVTILGSGKVVPILNSSDMLKSSRKHRSMKAKKQGTAPKAAMHQKGKKANSDKKILVVDDTLTARILLRNIFESAGFTIKTANHGGEALNALRTESFDLVVTDIEMPVMNGFELTEEIRKEAKFSELPVIMVTSMTSREDRERGVAVGANAYFVKSSFDQSNLLDVIASLV